MRIQINSSNGLKVPPEVRASVDAMLRERLARFDGIVTRIEVHFHPGDGYNPSGRDVLCGIEARIAGKKPLKSRHAATGLETTASRALDKLITVLNRRIARKYTTSKKGHVRHAGGSEGSMPT
jgi:hypothetical protein